MRTPLFRSPELRIVAAAVVAAVALGLAVLEVVAGRTDLLMVDFREWRPVGPRPDAAAFFESVQTVPPDLRPLQIDLRLAQPGSPSDFLAIERKAEVEGNGCYRFRVYVWSPTPSDSARALIVVNDEIAWSAPLSQAAQGSGVSLDGLRPRQGELAVRLELRAGPQETAASPPPSVRFEYAVLRHIPCEGKDGAGA